MSDLKASLAMGTAENFVQRTQQYADAVSAMGQRGKQVMGAFSSSLGQASAFIERLQAQLDEPKKKDDKTGQGANDKAANSPLDNVLEQAESLVNELSQAVDTTSTVIDGVSNAAGEVNEFSSASVSAWQAITSNKSKTSSEYWSGVFQSVSNAYKEGKDVVTSVQTVVDTLSGKALDKGKEAKKPTVSTSPLSKDVLATNAETALTEHRLAGGANNKGATPAANVQRVFVVNMPKYGAFAVQRDQTNNTSEPSWLDQVKSAVDIGKDLLDLGKDIKDFRNSGTKGESLLDLSDIAGRNENSDSKAHGKPQSLLPHLVEKVDADFDKPAVPTKRFQPSKWIKGIKGNGVVNALAGSAELAEVWNGDASVKEKVKQSGGVVGSVVGSGLGTWGGAAAGAAIGSVVPVIGTAVGGLIGGVLGSMGGGAVGESFGSRLTSWFTGDDEEKAPSKASKPNAQGAADAALDKVHGEIKISVEDKRVTVSSVTAHNLNLSIAGSSMGGHP
ncbi:MAG: hypothetical protein HWE14_12215 [Flavobacteriia bacterium]|nr:hypothetical protein [Flavobacteriia bacterium]